MEKDVMDKLQILVDNAVEKHMNGKNYSKLLANKEEQNTNRFNRSGENGIMFARFAKAALFTQREIMAGNSKAAGNPGKFQEDFLKKGYVKDTQFIAKLDKALTEGGDGGLLIPEIYSDEFIELLYDRTVVKEMGATIIPMEKGNISINKLIGGLTAQYIPEGGAASFTDISLGRVRLSSKKLMALTALSNDILRTNSYYADRIVLNDMMEAMAQAMDYAALYGTGGEDAPLGVANSEDIQKDTVAEVPTRSKFYEIKALLGKKNINLSDTTVGWVFGWDSWKNLVDEKYAGEGFINNELSERGTMLGHKALISNQVRTSGSTTDVFFGKWNDYLIGEEFNVEVAMDGSTSFTDTDGNVINAFTNDFIVYRAIMKHDMKLSRGVSFVKYIFNIA
jgi:HK97 family phage major capsid protein